MNSVNAQRIGRIDRLVNERVVYEWRDYPSRVCAPGAGGWAGARFG
jgi:hypothetical protein